MLISDSEEEVDVFGGSSDEDQEAEDQEARSAGEEAKSFKAHVIIINHPGQIAVGYTRVLGRHTVQLIAISDV
uniref:Uncharacterized protein n=1 Tax=Ditylenchus dipsaci TaxID=166011 RepID=A0A915DC51_9BILA